MFDQSKSDSRNEQIKSRNIDIDNNLSGWTSRIIKPLLIVLGTSLVTIASSQEAKGANFTVVASGLESPRGLTFGLDGSLYVAEAGRGGDGACIPSPSIQGAILCYGATGAIAKIDNGTVERLVTGLPSVASLNSS